MQQYKLVFHIGEVMLIDTIRPCVPNAVAGLLEEMVGMVDLLDAVAILDVNILGQFDEMKTFNKRGEVGMGQNDDLVQADFWVSMAFNKNAPDDELRKRFREFSLRADKMLLNDWEDYTDQRMLEVKKILREVIREKEGTKVLDVFKIFR